MSDCDEIVPNLWIGNRSSCADFRGRAMCVLDSPCPNRHKCLHMRILDDNGVARRYLLTQAAKMLHVWMRDSKGQKAVPVLVHCGAGVERSPLTVAWYLMVHHNMSLDAAYEFIVSKRPETEDRQFWLEPPIAEGVVLE